MAGFLARMRTGKVPIFLTARLSATRDSSIIGTSLQSLPYRSGISGVKGAKHDILGSVNTSLSRTRPGTPCDLVAPTHAKAQEFSCLRRGTQ